MAEKKEYKNVTFHCPIDVADRLDKMSEMGDIPRSKLILNMVETMLTYLEVSKKVGVLHFALLFREAGDKLKDFAKQWSEKKSTM